MEGCLDLTMKVGKSMNAFEELTTSVMEPLIPLPDPFDFPPTLDDQRENDGPFESTFFKAFHGNSTRPFHKETNVKEATFRLDRTKTISLETLMNNFNYPLPEVSSLRKSLSAQDVRSSNVVMKYLFSAKLPETSKKCASSLDLSITMEPTVVCQNSVPDERNMRLAEAVALELNGLISDDPVAVDFDDWELLMDEISPNVSLDYLSLSDEDDDEDSGFGLPKLRVSRRSMTDSVSDDAVTRYKAHRSSLRKDDETATESQTPVEEDEMSPETKDDGVNNATFEKTDAQPELPRIGNVKMSLLMSSQDIRIKKNICPATVKKGPVKALVPMEQISKIVAPAVAPSMAKLRVPAVLDKSTDSSFSGSLLFTSTPVKDTNIAPPTRPRNSYLSSAKRSKSVSSPRTNVSKLPSSRAQESPKRALKRPSSAPSNESEREALSTLPTNALKGTPKLGLKKMVHLPRPGFCGKENQLLTANRKSRAN